MTSSRSMPSNSLKRLFTRISKRPCWPAALCTWPTSVSEPDSARMDLALRLARRGYGRTSPNPMVGAVLVQSGRIIGRGWHRQAGQPHAEIEAMRDASRAAGTVSRAPPST